MKKCRADNTGDVLSSSRKRVNCIKRKREREQGGEGGPGIIKVSFKTQGNPCTLAPRQMRALNARAYARTAHFFHLIYIFLATSSPLS